jgi:hypothetical protein
MTRVLPLCLLALACTERRAEHHNPLTLSSPTASSRVTQAPGTFVRVGLMPEVGHAPEEGYPCRHCLDFIGKGERYLLIRHGDISTPHICSVDR